MSNTTYVDAYRRAAVTTASPLQLVLMLYDGALRFMEAGAQAIERRDLPRQNDQLQRAQRILLELTSCLDMDRGGEIAQNLFALYGFVHNQLVLANVEDDATKVRDALRVVGQLRDCWRELERQQRDHAEEPLSNLERAA